MPVKRIDHIAIVVPNVEEAAEFYENALGLTLQHIEEVEGQEVIVAFLPAGQSEIELVEPITDGSGIARFLNRHGPGIHHICLEVDDIEATLARLKEKGIHLINEEPTIGSGGKRVAFIHPKSTYGVLVELYEVTPEEPLIRASVLENLRKRLNVERLSFEMPINMERLNIERQAMTAGISAFLHSLRESTASQRAALGERVMNNMKRIGIRPSIKPSDTEDAPDL